MVSRGVRIAAAWSWRLLVIAAAAAAVLWVLAYIRLIMIPVVIALLLTALLEPAATVLRRIGVPRSLGSALVLIGGLAAVVGVLTLVVQAFIAGLPDLYRNVGEGIQQINNWLRTGPLNLSEGDLNALLENGREWLRENQDRFSQGALSTATATAVTLGQVITGLFLVLFATFFFMRDGRQIWDFLSSLFPRAAQSSVHGAGVAAWSTLTSYVRTTVLVAFIDAVGIGVGAAVLGLPLALPIGALVFLSSFIPIVGATVSGAVAVLVALVSKGPLVALIMFGIVLGVQQLEGNVLQPLIMGRAVKLHPLAVLVAIGAGTVVAGIIGALIAVPILAVLNTAFRYLHGNRGGAEPEPETTSG